MANLMLLVMRAFAEFERALIRERHAKESRVPNSVVSIEVASVRCPIRTSPTCAGVLNAAKRRRSSRAKAIVVVRSVPHPQASGTSRPSFTVRGADFQRSPCREKQVFCQ
jgi:hypothetical protein